VVWSTGRQRLASSPTSPRPSQTPTRCRSCIATSNPGTSSSTTRAIPRWQTSVWRTSSTRRQPTGPRSCRSRLATCLRRPSRACRPPQRATSTRWAPPCSPCWQGGRRSCRSPPTATSWRSPSGYVTSRSPICGREACPTRCVSCSRSRWTRIPRGGRRPGSSVPASPRSHPVTSRRRLLLRSLPCRTPPVSFRPAPLPVRVQAPVRPGRRCPSRRSTAVVVATPVCSLRSAGWRRWSWPRSSGSSCSAAGTIPIPVPIWPSPAISERRWRLGRRRRPGPRRRRRRRHGR
jgi:hypothetical protein